MIWYGSAYYPEHWPEARWATDAPRMQAAGFNVVRIGEFAWCRMEPQEGVFDFAWMDRAIATLNAQGIQVMIGTPTAGPPAWLVVAETPESDCRQVYEDGVRMEFGARSLCCVNHPRFRERSTKIARALGEQFGGHPGVMGFQLDNELGMFGARCFCAHCRQGFQRWLEAKYGTIEALNERLGMIFGGGEFRSFSDIPLLRLRQDLHNPGLLLDSVRFITDSNASYLADQAAALRGAGAGQPITTNVGGMFSPWADLNHLRLFDSLDVAGWDCYPVQSGTEPRSSAAGLMHTLTRGFKDAPFWILEQQSGSPMSSVSGDPRRIRLWAWQSLAHGAEMILYFRWRTCRFGGEQYWRGILDQDGEPNKRYGIVAETGREAAAQAERLGRLTRRNPLALLLDFDSSASLTVASPGGGVTQQDQAESWLAAAAKLGFGCDAVFDAARLSDYAVVAAPALRLMDPALAADLKAYVAGGGTLIVTSLTATLDRDHVVPAARPPWLLTDLLGVERVEWSSLSALPKPPKERLGEAAERWQGLNAVGQVPIEAASEPLSGVYTGSVWCDHLETVGAETLARFSEGSPAAGCSALTVQTFGAGQAYYLATLPDARLYRDLLASLLPPETAVQAEDPDADVEIVPAFDGGRRVFFVLNHTAQPQAVRLAGRWEDALTGEMCGKQKTLPPYDVSLLTELTD